MQGGMRAEARTIMPSAAKVFWFPNGSNTLMVNKVFPGVNINDGVSVVVSGKIGEPTLSLGGVVLGRPAPGGILPLEGRGAALVEVLPKTSIMWRRASTNVFGLRTYFVQRSPELVHSFGEPGRNCPDCGNFLQAYLGDARVGSAKKSAAYCVDAGAVDLSLKDRGRLLNSWKVVMSQGGANKNPEAQRVWVAPAGFVVGETLNILGDFQSEVEAENFAAYLRTPLVKYLLFLSKGGASRTLGLFVPDVGDYSLGNVLFKGVGDLPVGHDFVGLSLHGRLVKFFALGDDFAWLDNYS